MTILIAKILLDREDRYVSACLTATVSLLCRRELFPLKTRKR